MTTQFLKTSEGTIAYDDTGSGQLVICVPSMGDLRQEYRLLAPQMIAEGYRVVTMDGRAHGESSTTWSDYSVVGVGKYMLALIRHLDAGAAIILGESLSAGAAVWAATEAPEQVAGLVLLGAVVHDVPTPAYMTPLLNILFAPLWGVVAWGMYFNTLFPAHTPADFATYRQKLLANLREPGRLSALKAMMLAKKD